MQGEWPTLSSAHSFSVCLFQLMVYLFIYFCANTSAAFILFYFYISLSLFKKLLFKYSYLHFHPTTPPTTPILASHSPTYLFWLCPWVLYTCSLMAFPLFSSIIPLSHHLWLLSVCSLFLCHWLYCVCLFDLLIRFHL